MCLNWQNEEKMIFKQISRSTVFEDFSRKTILVLKGKNLIKKGENSDI